jgi:hypothetical protein
MKDKNYYVLLKETDVLGVFGSLKRLCDTMKGKDFPSYWTLIRKDFNRYDYGNYSLQVVKSKKRV